MTVAGMSSVERSLVMVKPDADTHADDIARTLKQHGFSIIQARRIQLTPAQASDFYRSQSTRITYTELVRSISTQPVTVLVCGKANAVADLNQLCGPEDPTDAKESAPESLRALYGTDIINNGVHASASIAAAAEEIRMFFPQTKLEPLASVEDTQAYLEEHINPTLLQGLSQLCKAKSDRPVEWIANWLHENNPNQPRVEIP